MAWQAPRTWVVGELVTAAFLNQDVRDNLLYLTTWSQNDVTGARAIDGTVYQNTTDMIMFVTVSVNCRVDGDVDYGRSEVSFRCDAATPPVTDIGTIDTTILVGTTMNYDIQNALSFTFIVLPNFYYKGTSFNTGGGVAPALIDWFEWNCA